MTMRRTPLMVRLLILTPYAVLACAGVFGAAHVFRWSTAEAVAGILLLPLLAALTYRTLLKSLGWLDRTDGEGPDAL